MGHRNNVHKGKVGSTGKPFRARIDDDGKPFDLTGSTIQFIMTPVGKSRVDAKVDAAATPDANQDAEEAGGFRGWFDYNWVDTDVDTAGTYDVELEVTLPNTKKFRVPDSSDDEPFAKVILTANKG